MELEEKNVSTIRSTQTVLDELFECIILKLDDHELKCQLQTLCSLVKNYLEFSLDWPTISYDEMMDSAMVLSFKECLGEHFRYDKRINASHKTCFKCSKVFLQNDLCQMEDDNIRHLSC